MTREWTNWSGSLRFRPGQVETPPDEQALCALVRRAAAEGRTVRVVGAGHSSSALVETPDTLVSLERMQGIEAIDAANCRATVGAGMRLHDAGQALFEAGLAMHNLGDIDRQSVAGAISTGTHGSGWSLPNLSIMLAGGRLVSGTGEVLAFSAEEEPEFLRAARVSLGVLGVFSSLTLQLLPAYQLQRREWCAHIEDCLADLDRLAAENRNVDFYWYPRSDEAKIRTLNPPGQGTQRLAYATCVKEQTGWSHEVIPRNRELKFEEMEYALPAEAGPACFRDVRERVKAHHRKHVGWRLLYRLVAPDDADLSPAHGRQTATISLHQNATLPYWEYFRDIEPVFRAYGGRTHWGKKHTLTAAELRPLYPRWDDFLEVRRQTDPQGVFLSPYLRALLGV